MMPSSANWVIICEIRSHQVYVVIGTEPPIALNYLNSELFADKILLESWYPTLHLYRNI